MIVMASLFLCQLFGRHLLVVVWCMAWLFGFQDARLSFTIWLEMKLSVLANRQDMVHNDC